MPVEIRELQITVSVQDQGSAQSSSPGQSQPVNNEAIIAKCVEQVLEILKEKSER